MVHRLNSRRGSVAEYCPSLLNQQMKQTRKENSSYYRDRTSYVQRYVLDNCTYHCTLKKSKKPCKWRKWTSKKQRKNIFLNIHTKLGECRRWENSLKSLNQSSQCVWFGYFTRVQIVKLILFPSSFALPGQNQGVLKEFCTRLYVCVVFLFLRKSLVFFFRCCHNFVACWTETILQEFFLSNREKFVSWNVQGIY